MSEDMKNQKQSPPWERHLQSILTSLVLAGIIWLGSTANTNSKNLAVMAVQLENLEARLTDLKGSMADRFTGADGKRLSARIDKLEDELGGGDGGVVADIDVGECLLGNEDVVVDGDGGAANPGHQLAHRADPLDRARVKDDPRVAVSEHAGAAPRRVGFDYRFRVDEANLSLGLVGVDRADRLAHLREKIVKGDL